LFSTRTPPTAIFTPSLHDALPIYVYMVRAVKLEETPAGSYYNLSQGAFYPDPLTAEIPDPPTNLIVSQITPGVAKIEWVERSASDRKSTRLNSSHSQISYAVFCLK